MGCCDKVNITSGTTTIMFGTHRYEVRVSFCKNCGSQKANSYIKHIREDLNEQHDQSIPRRERRKTTPS